MDFEYADLIRDYIILKHRWYIIDTKDGCTLIEATKEQIKQARERMIKRCQAEKEAERKSEEIKRNVRDISMKEEG